MLPIRRNCAAALRAVTLAACVLLAANPLAAQNEGGDDQGAIFRSIPWQAGPIVGKLGSIAEVHVPGGCRFTEADGTRKFLEATENPSSGDEQGLLLCRGNSTADGVGGAWFVVFSYDASGYVKDDEKSKLDADAILASLRDGNEMGNRERRSRGWEPLTIDGWVRPPYYDQTTHNLTWSTKVHGESEGPEAASVNHSVRLLGRGGVMHADLVIDPDILATTIGEFDQVVAGTTFLPGNTYGEWRQGDKVAAYGLTALVAGGAGAAAVKLGLFPKLWKLILAIFLAAKKLIILAVVAVLGFLKSLFGKKKDGPTPEPAG